MSLFGLFRGFFGFPERGGDGRRDRFFGEMMLDEEDGDDEDEESFTRRKGDDFSFSFGLGPEGRHFDDGFSGLFREMDELFKGIGSWDVPIGHFELPGIEPHAPAGGQEEEGSRQTPRDWMLKQPDRGLPGTFGRSEEGEGGRQPETRPGDGPARGGPSVGPLAPHRRPWNPSSNFEDIWKTLRQGDSVKEDKDLDSRVDSEGLENILKPSEPKVKSYFKSVSISKVVLPDGTVEERRTTRDGEGNEETKVTRAQGEQSYTTVTRRDAEGKEEQTEEMINMDDRDLQRFAENWERRERTDTLNEPQTFRDSLSLLDRLLKGIFSSR